MASLDLADIKNEIDGAIDAATSVADLADHFAELAKKYGSFIPGAGPEISAIAGFIDVGDKLLHSLKTVLG